MGSTDRDRLAGLLTFGAEILAAKEKVTFAMADYQAGGVFREELISVLPGFVVGTAEDGSWLRVKRLREIDPPSVPVLFDGWVDNRANNPDELPALKDARVLTVTIDEASELVEAGLVDREDCYPIDEINPATSHLERRDDVVLARLEMGHMPEFRDVFEAWLSQAWRPWATEEKPRRSTIRIYTSLFTLYSRMHGGADQAAFELVWGIGIVRWRAKPEAPAIDLPLIEQLVELELEKNGDIIVRPRHLAPVLAMRPYGELDIDRISQTQALLEAKLRDRLGDQNLVLTPFDGFSHEDILQLAANLLSPRGRLVSRQEIADGAPSEPPSELLSIYGSWAIYTRPRSDSYRRDDLRKMAAAVIRAESDDALPAPLRGFVHQAPAAEATPEDDIDLTDRFLGHKTGSEGRESSSTGATREVGPNPRPGAPGAYFFPLPYNEDQAKIIDRLEQDGAVVVTGPPGTGKSHTIANIIAHYMATGRRVLVTAKTAEAISVVREKLPVSLQPLAIAVIHSDREGARQLEDAVQTLADEAMGLDVVEANRKRQSLESKIVELDCTAQTVDGRLAAIAIRNLTPIAHRGRELMPMVLAREIEAERARHGWFADRPKPNSHRQLADETLDQLRELRCKLEPDLYYLAGAATLPTPDMLPGASELIAAHRAALADAARPGLDTSRAPIMARDTDDADDQARKLRHALTELDNWLARLPEWARLRYCQLVASRFAPASTPASISRPGALDEIRLFMEAAKPLRPARSSWPKWPSDPDVFWQAVASLAAGRNPLGFGGALFKRQLKAELEEVTLEGKRPESARDWQQIADTRLWRDTYEALRRKLGDAGAPYLTGSIDDPVVASAALEETMAIATAIDRQAAISARLAEQLLSLFPYGIDPKTDLAQAQHEELLLALQANLSEKAARHPAFDRLDAIADERTEPFFELIRELVDVLESSEPVAERDIVEARNTLAVELQRLRDLQTALDKCRSQLGAIAKAGAPGWCAMLADPALRTDEVLPLDWRESWIWAEGRGQIEEILALEDATSLREHKTSLVVERQRLLEELIRERTLIGLSRKLKDNTIRRALSAFGQATRNLGIGTGTQAVRWRRQIQEAALEAAPAAPVWIMPEHKVAEQLPARLGEFDLVVLDEASQSDVTALAALARGKQILIVGDDQQVSPTAIGIASQRIDELRTRFLHGIPQNKMIDAQTSVFDLTQLMLPNSQLMLREHFRSVAPIIQFSTRFYRNQLIPLRIPKPSERLDPPLIDVYLPHGKRASGINPAECDYIVEEVARIVNDEALAGRSLGVISLIGPHQARAIERRLIDHPDVGHEKIQAHRIICGDSTTLQGQERDIVLLSMVAGPTDATMQRDFRTGQRFNVALSRARDRLYLVRSVTASQLKPNDLKRQVIEHFADPMPDGGGLVDVELLERCESGFEQEVCKRLLDAGYRAIPQVRAGAYRIDIVVEGSDDRRMAVELDGDRFHGPDVWEKDMKRQAALERAGWVFWRVFGSQWHADPEHWWQDLVRRLDSLGIAPIGAERVNDVFTEHRVIESAQPIIADDEPSGTVGAPELPLFQLRDTVAPETAVDRPQIVASSASDGPSAEIDFDSIDFEPATVGPDMLVAVRFEDDKHTRVVQISSIRHDPDNEIIHIDQPLASALVGGSVDDTVELVLAGKSRSVTIEKIIPLPKAA